MYIFDLLEVKQFNNKIKYGNKQSYVIANIDTKYDS